jgi:O-antigen/teichoic acid export membrane protein
VSTDSSRLVTCSETSASLDKRISSSALLRSTIWNLGGIILPAIVAVFSIPFLTRGLGTDQFGILTLVSVVIGNLNIFDFGLGRALTKLVAEYFGSDKDLTIPPLFWTSFLLTLLLGIVAGFGLAAFSPWLVTRVLKIPPSIQADTLTTFRLLAFTMPAIVSTIALRGFLEGCHRFDLLNLVRVPVNVSSYLGPLLVLPFSHRIVPITVVLLISRWLGWMAHLSMCFLAAPDVWRARSVQGAPLRAMFGLGSWMTVTNLIAPVLVVLDRFIIGAIVSVAAVAYFATPFEVVTRLLIVPGAVVGVLFPAFSASLVQSPQRTAALFERSQKYLLLVLFPAVLLLVGFGREGLRLWLGQAFVDNSTRVLQLLSIGVFFNGMAFVSTGQVEGAGRPDISARFHILELPLYLITLWVLLHRYGIVGASLAWLLRTGIDSFLLLWAAGHVLPANRGPARRLAFLMLAAGGLLIVLVFLPSLWLRFSYVAVVTTAFSSLAWSHLLDSRERSFVYKWHRLRPQTA